MGDLGSHSFDLRGQIIVIRSQRSLKRVLHEVAIGSVRANDAKLPVGDLVNRHRGRIEILLERLAALVRDHAHVIEINLADCGVVTRLVGVLKPDRDSLTVALDDLVDGNRLREIETLQPPAADLLQEIGLLLGLDALSERVDPQAHRQAHELRDDDLAIVALAFVDSPDEAHVELDQVEADVLQRIERRITAAEIVHPDLEPQLLECLDLSPHELEVV